MNYDVTAIIEGEETLVICKSTENFIDVCEKFEEEGVEVIRVYRWEGSRINGELVEIDW